MDNSVAPIDNRWRESEERVGGQGRKAMCWVYKSVAYLCQVRQQPEGVDKGVWLFKTTRDQSTIGK